jgi:Calx-beta domain
METFVSIRCVLFASSEASEARVICFSMRRRGNDSSVTQASTGGRRGTAMYREGAGFSEASRTATVVVRRTGALGAPATVDYAVTGGTAVGGGVDYTLVSPGTLTFRAWQSFKTIPITVVNDSVAKRPRTIDLELSNPTGAEFGTPSTTVVTIKDNDVAGNVQFVATDYSVGELDGAATITVTRIGGPSGDATVDYLASGGSALDGTDYVATSGTLTFAAGQKTATLPVTILDEGVSDMGTAKTVQLRLSPPSTGADELNLGTPALATLWIVKE